MPTDTEPLGGDLPMADRFLFEVDGVEIGVFREVTGLQVTVNIVEVAEGGQNGFTHKLPSRMTWPNIIFKRGLTQSDALFDWLQKSSGEGFAGNNNKLTRSTGAVTARRRGRGRGCGRGSSSTSSRCAGRARTSLPAASTRLEEELEVAHHGFRAKTQADDGARRGRRRRRHPARSRGGRPVAPCPDRRGCARARRGSAASRRAARASPRPLPVPSPCAARSPVPTSFRCGPTATPVSPRRGGGHPSPRLLTPLPRAAPFTAAELPARGPAARRAPGAQRADLDAGRDRRWPARRGRQRAPDGRDDRGRADADGARPRPAHRAQTARCRRPQRQPARGAAVRRWHRARREQHCADRLWDCAAHAEPVSGNRVSAWQQCNHGAGRVAPGRLDRLACCHPRPPHRRHLAISVGGSPHARPACARRSDDRVRGAGG